MIDVAEYGKTRKHCDMLLLFLVLRPFLLPFPIFPPSYSFSSLIIFILAYPYLSIGPTPEVSISKKAQIQLFR